MGAGVCEMHIKQTKNVSVFVREAIELSETQDWTFKLDQECPHQPIPPGPVSAVSG